MFAKITLRLCRAKGPGTSLFTLWSEGERLRLVALQVLQLNCLSIMLCEMANVNLREASALCIKSSFSLASLNSYPTPPRFRRDYPLNLSISISGGKESKSDSLSSGERKGRSPAHNLLGYQAGGEILRIGIVNIAAHTRLMCLIVI